MDNKEIAMKTAKNIMIMMTVKWGIIAGLNAVWRRQVKKALTEHKQDES